MIRPMVRGHSPNTQQQVIPYTPIYLPSPLVRSCPRATDAQAPPTAAAAGLGTFWPWSHSCRAGELCTLDFQLSMVLQRGSSECFVGSALCAPKLLQALPKPFRPDPEHQLKAVPLMLPRSCAGSQDWCHSCQAEEKKFEQGAGLRHLPTLP